MAAPGGPAEPGGPMQDAQQAAAPSIEQWGLDRSTPHPGASRCHPFCPQTPLRHVSTGIHGAVTQIGEMIRINTKSPSPEEAMGQSEAGAGAGGQFALRASPHCMQCCHPSTSKLTAAVSAQPSLPGRFLHPSQCCQVNLWSPAPGNLWIKETSGGSGG